MTHIHTDPAITGLRCHIGKDEIGILKLPPTQRPNGRQQREGVRAAGPESLEGRHAQKHTPTHDADARAAVEWLETQPLEKTRSAIGGLNRIPAPHLRAARRRRIRRQPLD